MATESQQGGHGGHEGPLSNDLPPKPAPWRPQIHGFRNTYFEDRLDWTPIPHDPLGPPDDEVVEIASALAARMNAERSRRSTRQYQSD